MINLKEELLKKSHGIEYFKLWAGFTNVPDYACRTIEDFMTHRGEVKPMDQIVIPRVVYFPKQGNPGPKRLKLAHMWGGWALHIRLRDAVGGQTAEIDAFARSTAFNPESGEWLMESISNLDSGEKIYNVILRNGLLPPDSFLEESRFDDRVYLAGFQYYHTPRSQKGLSDLLEKVADLIPEFGFPNPQPLFGNQFYGASIHIPFISPASF